MKLNLSDKDKEWLLTAIKQIVIESLTVEWTMEKTRDEKTGQPLAKPELKKENIFIPSAILQMLPYHEGALRGMQEDVNKNNNKINDLDEKIKFIGNILIQTENSLKCLASISDNIKKVDLDNPINIKVIED